MMKTLVKPLRVFSVIFVITFILFSSCQKEIINRPADAWEKWEQQLPDTIAFFAGSSRIVEFKKDSFRSKIESWTDVCETLYITDSLGNIIDTIVDPCNWTDYVKGTYSVNNDSMFFTGKWYDSLYTTIQTGFNDFVVRCKFIRNNDTTLTLNPDGTINYSDIVLKKR